MLFLGALALVAAQAPPIPFDEAGKALLELAGHERAKGASVPSQIAARIRPQHERLRLGALELWVPKRVLDDELAAKPGPSAKEVAPIAAELVALQREWLDRLGARGEPVGAASAALATLEGWAKDLRRFGEPKPEIAAARSEIERIFFRAPIAEQRQALVLVLAPTRAQYIGTIGAAALLAPADRDRLCDEAVRHNMSTSLAGGVTLVACSAGPSDSRRSPLDQETLSLEDLHQGLVHAAAHLVSVSMLPTAPAWWLEGLAICDTIATLGGDETLCSGSYEPSGGSGYSQMGGSAGILLWVTRQKSPYRESYSASYFVEPLRQAWSRDGFQVIDLETMQPSYRVAPPLLPEGSGAPEIVSRGTSGTRRGFAELYRAYCAAFVHWMDGQPSTDQRSLLAMVCAEVAKVPYRPNPARIALYDLAHMVSGKTLGRTNEAAADLEGAFVAWLAAR